MISALIPARGRPENLGDSIRSLLTLAKHPDLVEIIVRLDDDDPRGQEILNQIQIQKSDRITVISGERWGYEYLYKYYNQAAVTAKGTWLMLWNDDAEMLTSDWDVLLRSAPAFAFQFFRRDTVLSSDFTFFAVGRPVYAEIGYFSPEPHSDVFASHVAMHSGTAIIRDDIVFRHLCLPAVDRTIFNDAFHSPERRKARNEAIANIVKSSLYEDRFTNFIVQSMPRDPPPYPYLVDGLPRQSVSYFLR